ncbi:MAG: carbohydrate-binding protein [Eubacteriales bacterium]|nr:carbohydrate-binding protein [Eubacteriales bacterium]
MEHMIRVLAADGGEKAAAAAEGTVTLVWEGAYEEGDKIILDPAECGRFYKVRIDDAMDEDLVYVAKTPVEFLVPFKEKKTSYNPKSFSGSLHCVSMRPALEEEIYSFRNLAKNAMDQHGDPGCYPHASANVETRGEAVFAARNAIDGMTANRSHGNWPYESWGINRQDDAELTLEFGRPVDVERILLYTRADFPHDNWWEQVTFAFSDGSEETVSLKKSLEPHVIPVKKTGISWLKFGKLIKADDPSPFPALTQIEVYGRYCR